MKLLILLTPFFVLAATQQVTRQQEDELWSAYKHKFRKSYGSTTSDRKCKNTFWQHAIEIRSHNLRYERGLVSYKMDLNDFCDRDNAEFIRQYTGLQLGNVSNAIEADPVLYSRDTTEVPAEYDGCAAIPNWTVRNQQSCGTCWAFSAIASIEAAYYQKNGTLLDLSEQHLNDCVYGRNGCDGGWMPVAYDYIKTGKTIEENSYPYTSKYGKCVESGKPRSVGLNSQTSYYKVASDDDSIKQKIRDIGPLSVAVDCTEWMRYSSGVYSSTRSFGANHAVVLCGWGTDPNAGSYWILRNQWGAAWGNQGYIYVSSERNSGSQVTKGGLFTQYIFYPALE